MALLVLDASIFIALLDSGDAHHQRVIRALESSRDDTLVLPATAYAEVLVGAYGRNAAAVQEVDDTVRDLRARIEPIGTDVARRAAQLRSGFRSLRSPDALVVAMAEVLDGTALTADAGLRRISRRVRLV